MCDWVILRLPPDDYLAADRFRVAEIGLQALDNLQENRLISPDLRQRNIEFLKSSEKPQAVLLFMVAPSVELLVQATRTQWRIGYVN